MMGLVAQETSAGRIWLARPNCSLSVNGSHVLLFFVAVVTGLITLAFSLLGAWPIIPFAGAELVFLWWALKQIALHAGDFERITLKSGLLTIETHLGSHIAYHEFPVYWARLECLKLTHRNDHRLLIHSHGKEMEIGSLLTEKQKMALAKALKTQLGAQ